MWLLRPAAEVGLSVANKSTLALQVTNAEMIHVGNIMIITWKSAI